MAEIDRSLFDKATEVTATALRGAMGGEGSQPPPMRPSCSARCGTP